MNIDFGKRQRWFLAGSVWFLPVPAILFISIEAWKHVRKIVTFGAALLIPALCYADTLTAQSNSEKGSESPQIVSSGTYFLGPPNNGGPAVVRAAFQLQDINVITRATSKKNVFLNMIFF